MCKKCGKPINQTEMFRSSTCEFCGSDLHSCINCKFYEPGSHYDCHESVQERVSDKEKANFCDYFSVVSLSSFQNSDTAKDSKTDKATFARNAFASLFGN